LGPGSFNLLPACPTHTFHIAKTKLLAVFAVPVNVPIWYADLDRHSRIKLQIFGKCFHTPLEMFAPLAADVVRYDDTWNLDACKRREDYVVHVAVPEVPIEFESEGK
jgi:hypothetical protein